MVKPVELCKAISLDANGKLFRSTGIPWGISAEKNTFYIHIVYFQHNIKGNTFFFVVKRRKHISDTFQKKIICNNEGTWAWH